MEQKHPIAWHVPNLINICIDSVDDGEMTGKIYHCYSEEAIAFSNIIRMIETVEEFFVNKNVKKITNYYTIAEKREKVKKVNIVTENVMFPVMSDEIEYQHRTKQ